MSSKVYLFDLTPVEPLTSRSGGRSRRRGGLDVGVSLSSLEDMCGRMSDGKRMVMPVKGDLRVQKSSFFGYNGRFKPVGVPRGTLHRAKKDSCDGRSPLTVTVIRLGDHGSSSRGRFLGGLGGRL